MIEVNCIVCRKKFIALRRNKKYCSVKCKNKVRTHNGKLLYEDRKDYYKQRYINKKKEIRLYEKEYRLKQKQKLLNLIGKKCEICDTKEKIVFHEKFGKEHQYKFKYTFDHKNDFIALCSRCHDVLHKYNIIKCQKFNELLSLLGK